MAFSLPHVTRFNITCSATRDGSDHNNVNKLHNIKINGTSNTKIDLMIGKAAATATFLPVSVSPTVEVGFLKNDQFYQNDQFRQNNHFRQNIPTEKQFLDPFRQGLIIEEGVGYRQTVVIRSYEVGPDKTATLESILNLLQDTALNHVWMSGLLGDGFGATHGMMKNNLIWVVSRMQVQVDHYPIWGEVMEIDTWVGASGKNGMRRDWELRSQATGLVFARATSTWVMMNQKTRRLSKMPDEVRCEIAPWFIEKQAIKEEVPEKIEKLDDKAKYVNSDLQPKRSDLDMNHHVNNVKYVRWMLEAIPDEFLENNQLSGIILEYRKECGSSDIVQSLCEPDKSGIIKEGLQNNNIVNGYSLGGGILQGNGILGCLDEGPFRYTHLLQAKGEKKNEEIVRGKTSWKPKLKNIPFSSS